MSDHPVTTVVIPCHDCELTLGLQLESLSRQIDAQPFEIVVVDNRSSDRTVEVARQWSSYLDLRVVNADEIGSVAYARNTGVAAARARRLVFLDGDDAVPNHFIGYCQRAFEDGFEVFATGFWTLGLDEFDQGLDHLLEALACSGHGEEPRYRPPEIGDQDANWPIMSGCGFGMTKDLYIGLGGFDLTACPGAEDNDLAIRATRAGHLPLQLSCTSVAYRDAAGDRVGWRVPFERAMSVVRVRALNGLPLRASSSFPWSVAVRSLAAGARLVVRPGATPLWRWRRRAAIDLGLAVGWTVYGPLRRVPQRRLGVGLGPS